jgi:tRNA (adenine57-N1/adenine58-N1)-methyltransferase
VRFLDLERGDKVLEAGTGNGSLTLYLARAISGSKRVDDPYAKDQQGRIDTFDIRESHSRQAEINVTGFARGDYRNSVKFYIGKLSETLPTVLSDRTVGDYYDGAILDMPEPHHELETVVKYLKNDRFLVCYLPNITQVVDLLRHIKSNNVPLALDECVDVQMQEWEVRGTIIRSSNDPTLQVISPTAWVCRPKNFDVKGHTAYLVKLRKVINIEPSMP